MTRIQDDTVDAGITCSTRYYCITVCPDDECNGSPSVRWAQCPVLGTTTQHTGVLSLLRAVRAGVAWCRSRAGTALCGDSHSSYHIPCAPVLVSALVLLNMDSDSTFLAFIPPRNSTSHSPPRELLGGVIRGYGGYSHETPEVCLYSVTPNSHALTHRNRASREGLVHGASGRSRPVRRPYR